MNSRIQRISRGFTMIELLVVIAIIGILAAVLLGTFSGGSESAKTALCLSNMRNLAMACQNAGTYIGHYPPAGSVETADIIVENRKVRTVYSEVKGWISWDSRTADYVQSGRYSHHSNPSISLYSTDREAWMFALTNGVIWKYVNEKQSVYQCPQHIAKMKKRSHQLYPVWSYVMNGRFMWDRTHGSGSYPDEDWGGTHYGSLHKADRVLLFAEIQFDSGDKNVSFEVPTETSGETTDSILQYPGCTGGSTEEVIGFNHKSNRKRYCANVVFADAHTEKLLYPEDGNASSIRDLTKWLCTGIDVSFDGKTYEKLDQ